MAPQQPYFPNDPLFIFFPNGGIEASQMFVWDGSKPILWDGKVTFSGSITIGSITGDKTNNNAAPGADNLGVLPALANAAHPTYTEGNLVLLSTDLQGNLRTIFSGSLPAGSNVIGHVIVDSSGLPTGAATEATLNDCETDLDTIAAIDFAKESGGNLASILTALNILSAKYTPYKYITSGSSNQDSQVVKNSAGRVGYISCFSTVAAARIVKLYDKATGPTSSDTPVYVAAIPNNTTGAGSNLSIPNGGINFASGISHRVTSGLADNDTGAASTDSVINIGYV